MSSFDTIRISTDSHGVAHLWLARPEKHNALNAKMIEELRSATELLAHDDTVRVVILAGEGKSFCAGGDLTWMQEQAAKDREGKIAESTRLAKMLRDLDGLPKPLIGRVQGNAFGGGIGMMAVCDIVVAADRAIFALTETRLGLIPATIGPYVVRRLGEGHARQVFMNGKRFDATEARRLGLVSRVAGADELNNVVSEEINWFLDCAPGAVAETKALCLTLSRGGYANALSATAERLADRWDSTEAQAGIQSFFDHTKPPWVRGS